MIKDVVIKDLRVVPDERGRLGEIIRSDWVDFAEFGSGQVYFTTSYPGVVKAWHLHKKQDDRVSCISGMVRLAMYDARSGSETEGELQEVYMGVYAPKLVRIPKGVYHGWKCVSEGEAIMINVPTNLYDYENPDEERLPYDTDKIPYDWSLKHG